MQFITVGNDAPVCIWNLSGIISTFLMTSIQDNIHTILFISENNFVIAADSPLLYVYSLPVLNNNNQYHHGHSNSISSSISNSSSKIERKSHDQLLGSQHRDSIQILTRITSTMFASASVEGVVVIWKDTLQGYGRLRVFSTLNNIVSFPTSKINKISAMIRVSRLLAVAINTSIFIFDCLKSMFLNLLKYYFRRRIVRDSPSSSPRNYTIADFV